MNNNLVRQIVLIAVLAATLGYALFTYWPVLAPLVRLPGRGKKPAAIVTAPSPVPAEPKVTASIEAAAKSAEDLTLELPTAEAHLVDPFSLRTVVRTQAEEPVTGTTLPSGPPVKPPEPDLQGIWLDSGMEIAFISDQSLQVGGKVMGWELISISPDHVVLRKGGATKTLYLK